MRTPKLPAHCDYWVVKPNDDAIAGHDGGCGADANGYNCTMDADHALPHVASAVVTIAAVWDDVWYADGNGLSCPRHEVS